MTTGKGQLRGKAVVQNDGAIKASASGVVVYFKPDGNLSLGKKDNTGTHTCDLSAAAKALGMLRFYWKVFAEIAGIHKPSCF